VLFKQRQIAGTIGYLLASEDRGLDDLDGKEIVRIDLRSFGRECDLADVAAVPKPANRRGV
jgi:hypothetical protein